MGLILISISPQHECRKNNYIFWFIRNVVIQDSHNSVLLIACIIHIDNENLLGNNFIHLNLKRYPLFSFHYYMNIIYTKQMALILYNKAKRCYVCKHGDGILDKPLCMDTCARARVCVHVCIQCRKFTYIFKFILLFTFKISCFCLQICILSI